MLTSESPPRGEGSAAHLLEDRAPLLAGRLRARTAHVAVLGLGYAGLPMAVHLAQAGFMVTGLDVDEERVRRVGDGESPVSGVADRDVAGLVEAGRLRASGEFAHLAEADCALICVPTPLTPDRRPDLRFVEMAARSIAAHLHPGMLVILQSTCGPGTTRGVLSRILEDESGLQIGRDLFLAFAPERIDPGNRRYTVSNTPKVIGGITPRCTALATELYRAFVDELAPVSSPEVAEMAKLVENTFRFINISFVNEVAQLCDRIGISIWEVIDAATTKPFAFMPHYPGAGVGGHCIPIVPFYLQAAAHEHGLAAELVEAAGRVNDRMPAFVVAKLARLLAERGTALDEARVLLLGIAYKADVADVRESPSLRVLELLLERGVRASYYDPHVSDVRAAGKAIQSLSGAELAGEDFDCAVLLTAHSGIDYAEIARRVDLLFDTRNHLVGLEGAPVVPI